MPQNIPGPSESPTTQLQTPSSSAYAQSGAQQPYQQYQQASAQPYQQQSYQQPQPNAAQPFGVLQAPAPLTQLSGGMKFGWLVVGALGGIVGILIAWLTNADKAPSVKGDAIKFAVIGLVINIVVSTISGIFLGISIAGMIAAAASDPSFSSSGYYY